MDANNTSYTACLIGLSVSALSQSALQIETSLHKSTSLLPHCIVYPSSVILGEAKSAWKLLAEEAIIEFARGNWRSSCMYMQPAGRGDKGGATISARLSLYIDRSRECGRE
jgi:hypothetical protein